MNDSHSNRQQKPLSGSRGRPASLGWVILDCRVVSDRACNSSNELPGMSAAEGYFELHTAIAVPSNKRNQIVSGFANFSKDGTPANTFGKQLEEIAALEPTSQLGQLIALRAKTAEFGQPASPTSFDGWNIALKFQNISVDTTDHLSATLGDDVYHRIYTAGTELVVEITLRVPLGTDIASWGALRTAIETEDGPTLEGAKDDLITIVQNESLGLEAENIIDSLTLQ